MVSTTTTGVTTVKKLADARGIDATVMRVAVLEDGKPAITLQRRDVGGIPEGLSLRSHIGAGIVLPRSSVVVDSIVEGQITIGENVLLQDCEIRGAGRIPDDTVLRGYLGYGRDEDTLIPLEPHRVSGPPIG